MMPQRRRMLANVDTNLIKPSMFFNDYVASNGVLHVNLGISESIRFPCKPNTKYTVKGKQTGDATYICYFGFFNIDTLVQGAVSTNGQGFIGRLLSNFSFTTGADTKYVVICTSYSGIQDFTKWVIKEG